MNILLSSYIWNLDGSLCNWNFNWFSNLSNGRRPLKSYWSWSWSSSINRSDFSLRYFNWSSFNRSWSLSSSDFNRFYLTSHHRFSSNLSLRFNSYLSLGLNSNLSSGLNSDLSLRLRLDSNLSFNLRFNSNLFLRLNSNLSLNLRLNSNLSLRLNSNFSLNRSRNSYISSNRLNRRRNKFLSILSCLDPLWSWPDHNRTSNFYFRSCLYRSCILNYNFFWHNPFLFIKRSNCCNISLILFNSIVITRFSSLNLWIVINNMNNFTLIVLILMALYPTSNVIDSTMLEDTI